MKLGGPQSEKFISGNVSQLDRHLRLVVTEAGPRYSTSFQVEQCGYRRMGYVYYNAGFAELLFILDILPDVIARPRAIRERLLERFIEIGCESASLLPTTPDVFLSILEEVLRNTDASDIRRWRLSYLSENTELEVLRHDGAYKALMSVTGKPGHGSQIRPRE